MRLSSGPTPSQGEAAFHQLNAAFTILELLVAVSITVVLAGMILSITTGTLKLWRRAQGGAETSAQAQLALGFLERDLQGAIIRRDSGPWLATDVFGTTTELAAHGWFTAGTIKPGGTESQLLVPAELPLEIGQARFGASGCWLRFFTTKVDDNSTDRTLSAPSAVSYQILRRRVGSDNTEARYRLYRSEVRQEATAGGRPGAFQSGYDVTAGNYATASGTQGDAGTVIAPATGDALADNMVDFGVWFYVRDPGGALQRVYPMAATDFSYRAPSAGVIPEVADVALRILSPEGVTRLNALEMGRVARPADYANDAEWWWAVVEAYSTVFVRRVELKGVGP